MTDPSNRFCPESKDTDALAGGVGEPPTNGFGFTEISSLTEPASAVRVTMSRLGRLSTVCSCDSFVKTGSCADIWIASLIYSTMRRVRPQLACAISIRLTIP